MGKVGDDIIAENANWTFEGDVVNTFDDHVSKSVPFYHETHQLAAQISDFFIGNGSICYELGCSTGQLTSLIAERNKNKEFQIIGIDSVSEMIKAAELKCKNYQTTSFINDNMVNVEFEKSDLFLSFYSIQFVHPKLRQDLINRIYNSLNWGGAFLILEKVRAPDARFQDMMTAIYHDYKMDTGFSAEEVISKSQSLRGVLEPFSTQGNLDLFKRAGFQDIISVYKWVCWEAFLAIK